MEIESFTSEVVLKDGIYFSKKKAEISYPEKGNDDFFNIEENSFWFNHRNRCIIEAFKKYSKKNIFFDIGGGNGYQAKSLQNVGIETVLVEPGVSGCMNAKKRGLKNIVCSTLQEAHFKENSIPNIGLFDVVEHIEDDLSFLKMIHSYLETNGLIFITVPAYMALWSNEDIDAGHYRRYKVEDMERILKNLGFEIQYSSYLFSLLPLPIFISRTLPSKLGLNKNSGDFNKHKSEHTVKSGALDSVLNYFWDREIDKVKKGSKISFGSSCFIIAKKK